MGCKSPVKHFTSGIWRRLLGRSAEATVAFKDAVLTKRIHAGRAPIEYEEYLASGGYRAFYRAMAMGPAEIIKVVTDSGLRGRGGAGAGAGVKWAFMPKEKKG